MEPKRGRKRDQSVEHDRLRTIIQMIVDQEGMDPSKLVREAGFDTASKEWRAAYQAIKRWSEGRESKVQKPKDREKKDQEPKDRESKDREKSQASTLPATYLLNIEDNFLYTSEIIIGTSTSNLYLQGNDGSLSKKERGGIPTPTQLIGCDEIQTISKISSGISRGQGNHNASDEGLRQCGGQLFGWRIHR